jgi:hypothetical protein
MVLERTDVSEELIPSIISGTRFVELETTLAELATEVAAKKYWVAGCCHPNFRSDTFLGIVDSCKSYTV